MIKAINKKIGKKLYTTITRSSKRKILIGTVLYAVFFFCISLSLTLSSVAIAQELPYPNPLSPPNGGSVDKITSVYFSWTPYYVGTMKYSFELSKNPDMSSPVIKTTTNDVTYMYPGTLEYNTTYYWRVMAIDPLGGEYGSAIFRTKANPASTNNATAPQPPQDSSKSFISSIVDSLNKIGWPLVVGIVAGLIIIIIAILYLMKPKSPPGGQRQWQGPQSRPQMQQPFICSACGFQNAPERKFCNNCGSGLIVNRAPPPPPPQQQWGVPQAITCPTCSLPNPLGQTFCSRCGTDLTSIGQQQQWRPQQPTICPTCGSPNPPGQAFCNNCRTNFGGGSQQQAWQIYQTFTCPICGATINKGINPCTNCGTWLDWRA